MAAKFIQGEVDQKEIGAYQISQLLSTKTVPLTIPAKRREGTIQEFLTEGVTLVEELINENPNAAAILHSIPSCYLQLYLIQAMLLGQRDGHLYNTFIQLSEGDKFVKLWDIDNEKTFAFPFEYYETGFSSEGRGARIALMGLDQAKQPLSRALLLLFSSYPFQSQLKHFFYGLSKKISYGALAKTAAKERIEKIGKLCTYALENGIPLSCEEIYFTLFTHEDYVNKQREYGIPDLLSFNTTQRATTNISTSIDDFLDRTHSDVVPSICSKNLQNLLYPTKHPHLQYTKTDERYGGQKALETLRKTWEALPNQGNSFIPLFDPIEKNMIDLEKWDGKTTDPLLVQLCLDGLPGIAARRISREFPHCQLFIDNSGQSPSLYAALSREMTKARDQFQNNKNLTMPISSSFYACYQENKGKLEKRLNEKHLPIKQVDPFPETAAKWVLLWAINAGKEVTCTKEGEKYWLCLSS